MNGVFMRVIELKGVQNKFEYFGITFIYLEQLGFLKFVQKSNKKFQFFARAIGFYFS
jgi:hypothetical protein